MIAKTKTKKGMPMLTQYDIKVYMYAREFIRQRMHSALRTTNHLVRNIQSDGILCVYLNSIVQTISNKYK